MELFILFLIKIKVNKIAENNWTLNFNINISMRNIFIRNIFVNIIFIKDTFIKNIYINIILFDLTS